MSESTDDVQPELHRIEMRRQRWESDEPDIDPDADVAPTLPWRLDDGRVGVTHEQCNAVRCAAHDGLPYRAITELFSFVSGPSHAQRHATGKCRHAEGVEPVGERRPLDSPPARVTARECRRLRSNWKAGRFDSYEEAADWAGIARSAAWRHINGECQHG